MQTRKVEFLCDAGPFDVRVDCGENRLLCTTVDCSMLYVLHTGTALLVGGSLIDIWS